MTRNTAKIIVVLMVIIALISVICTVFIPTHTGEIRQDLREGDYYIQETDNLILGNQTKQEIRIIGFTDTGDLTVRITENEKVHESVMTRSMFLDNIIFQSDKDKYQSTGYATLDTAFGNRFCTVYEKDDCQYWVGEHDIVYKYSIHGIVWRLIETSLIIK